MKIVFASDHAGYELKEHLKHATTEMGYDVEDVGAYEYDADDDYPEYIAKAARRVHDDPEGCRAVVLGGSGQGEAIVANRFKNVRAVVVYTELPDTETEHSVPILTREHNDANVLSLGARFLSQEGAVAVLKTWLQTPFREEERHKRRIRKIEEVATMTE